MRSHTHDDLPGRCKRCWIRVEQCVCALLVPLQTQVRVLFVRHHMEARKSTGTARVAHLALPNSQVFDFTDDPDASNAALPHGLDPADSWLLYPDETAQVPVGPVRNLVVLDGTWRQTRKMVKKLPAVAHLPRVRLAGPPADVLRLRETSLDDGRSTLEATAEALALCGEADVSRALLALHAVFVQRVLTARGVWEQKQQQFAARVGPAKAKPE